MEDTATSVGDIPMLPVPSPTEKPPAIPDRPSLRNAGNEELERSNVGQSDERTIYEHGRDPPDSLRQRLENVVRQREQMQQVEIELRAKIIARAEIAEMQKGFDVHVKKHVKEQFHEREEITIHDLQRKVEEKGRELIEVKRDNEDKRRQIIDLHDQCRVAEETLKHKDEQLREAHAWLARIQEVDAVQFSSLQEELREHMARVQEMNGPQTPVVQPELQEQPKERQALREILFPTDSLKGKMPMIDRYFTTPTTECGVHENEVDYNHHSAEHNGCSIYGDLMYKDITEVDIQGMVFDSIEAAEMFYKRYAIAVGFSIRKQDLRRRNNGDVVMHKWVCNKAGTRQQKHLDRENRQRKPRPITRVGCPASFRVNVDKVGKWVVKQAILEHNHELASPLENCFVPSNGPMLDTDIKSEKRLKT